MQTHTNNVNKTRALLQTTGGKDEQGVTRLHISVVYLGNFASREIFTAGCQLFQL